MRAKLAATLVAMFALGPVVAAGLAPASEADLGRALYSNCAACHGDAGQGGFAPAFVANANLKDGRAAIAHVLVGSVNMPPFAEQLSNAEIAAVLN
ncbi:MAG: cytochrome c, partial [Sphingomonadales bacterium]